MFYHLLKCLIKINIIMDQEPEAQFEDELKRKLKEQKKEQEAYYTKIIQHLFKIHSIKKSSYQGELSTPIQQLLSINPNNRNHKHLKKIRAEMKQFECFKTIKKVNSEMQDIIKKDNETIQMLISPFGVINSYKKGQIVECSGLKRDCVRILLSGKVSFYDPLSSKSYKNCLIKIKNKEYNMELIRNGISLFEKSLFVYSTSLKQSLEYNEAGKQSKELNNDSIISAFLTDNQNSSESEEDKQEEGNLPTKHTEHYNSSQLYMVSQQLTKKQVRFLLHSCNIIGPLTPHKNSYDIINKTTMLLSDMQPLFADQKNHYKGTAVCLTDCNFLEIDYDICRQIIQLINSDKQKPYIRALLFKFPMLEYFEAKKYVTQQYMLINQNEQKSDNQMAKKNQHEDDSEEDLEEKQKTTKAKAFIKELKVVSNFHCEIKYTGSTYLIISGKVSLLIDIVSQKKTSLNEYASSHKKCYPKEILQLCNNDIFGFEEIGKKKQANLRYNVEKGSKLLKLNPLIMKTQFISVFGFEKGYQSMKKTRNDILNNIVGNMEINLQKQEIKRHEVINKLRHKQFDKKPIFNSISTSPKFAQVKQAKFYGHKGFQQISQKLNQHFSPQNNLLQKQKLSPELVKDAGLGIEFSTRIVKKHKSVINIQNDWIQMRDRKGKLLRKKRVSIEKEKKSQEVEKTSDLLLRKLGILSTKEIADHNFEIVTKRKSDYEFADLQKQAKQFKRLREKATSLPKLTNFFSKKQDRLFNIINKRKQ